MMMIIIIMITIISTKIQQIVNKKFSRPLESAREINMEASSKSLLLVYG